jgi:hypothetical protein
MTEDLKKVSEEEKKDNARFEEIKAKKEEERTPEEKKEFGEIKERYAGRAQKRIDQLTGRAKAAEAAKEEAEKRAKEAEERAKKFEGTKPEPTAQIIEETEEAGGKKWHTNKALNSMVQAGKITWDEANEYALKRDEEKLVERVEKRQDEKNKQKKDTEARAEDTKSVLKNYPQFSNKHADFNPEDPLYKLTNQLYYEAYASNPKGLSLAVKRAKAILGIKDTHIDRSGDLNVGDSPTPLERKPKETEITLNEAEELAAINQFTRGDVINPKTGRAYTEKEALAKALEAKKARKET